MAPNYRPEGYPVVSPYLLVTSSVRTIEFLTQVFEAVELRRMARPDGTVMHAEVRLGDSVIMMGDAMEGWPAQPAHVHVYVADVDETYRKALAAGGEVVQEPVQKGDEDKRCGVKDLGGTTWWIATRVG